MAARPFVAAALGRSRHVVVTDRRVEETMTTRTFSFRKAHMTMRPLRRRQQLQLPLLLQTVWRLVGRSCLLFRALEPLPS